MTMDKLLSVFSLKTVYRCFRRFTKQSQSQTISTEDPFATGSQTTQQKPNPILLQAQVGAYTLGEQLGEGSASHMPFLPRRRTRKISGMAAPLMVFFGCLLSFESAYAQGSAFCEVDFDQPLNPQVSEGTGTAFFPVTLTGFAGAACSFPKFVEYAVNANPFGAGPNDYGSPTTGTLIFTSPGTQTISLPIFDDAEPEAEEDFTITLSAPNEPEIEIGQGTLTVSILDNDPTGTLQFTAAGATITEGDTPNTATVTAMVERVGGSAGTLGADFQTVNGTAIAGADYTLTSGSLTFDSGDTTPQPIIIQITSDTAFETPTSETFTLELFVGNDLDTFTVTINDDDSAPLPGTLQFTAAGATVTEGNVPNTVIVSAIVERVGGSDGTLNADFSTLDGTAIAGEDYTATGGGVDFGPGDVTPQQIEIQITSDTIFEDPGSEDFVLQLFTDTGQENFTVTINDDDSPPLPGTLQFTAAGATVTEGDTPNTVTVTAIVERVGGSAGTLNADFSTLDGTANASADYTLTSGSLTFDSGDTTPQPIVIQITSDTAFETPTSETFTLELFVGNELDTFTVTINDDDSAPTPGTLQFTAAGATVTEGDTPNTVTVTAMVERVGGSDGTLEADFGTVDGTAIANTANAGGDYTSTSGDLTFDSGDTTPQPIIIQITSDTAFETPTSETFTLELFIGNDLDTFTVTINDDDSAPLPGTLQFTAAGATVTEGNEPNTVIVSAVVERVGGSDGTLNADFSTLDGTAIAGEDYTATGGGLDFEPGDVTPQQIEIQITSDTIFEDPGSEDFVLQLFTSGGVDTFTVTINDDDSPPQRPVAQMTLLAETVVEGATTIGLMVQEISGTASCDFDVRTIANGNAEPGNDYTALTTQTINLPAGTTVAIPAISVLTDTITPEAGETFGVQIFPAGGSLIPCIIDFDDMATVTITDVPPAPTGSLEFATDGVTVTEGDTPNTVTVSAIVERVGGSAGPLSIPFRTIDGSALDGQDYTATSGELTFDAGDTTPQTIEIEIISDSVFETPSQEIFQLEMGDGFFTVTIEEDDSPPPSGTLQFTAAGATVTEGDAPNTVIVSAIVERVGGSAGTLTTDFQTVDGSALDGLDYTATFGTLTFDASDTTPQTIDIEIISDTVFETPALETFELQIGDLLGGAVTVDGTFTVTIEEDDSPPPSGTLQFTAAGATVTEGDAPNTVIVSAIVERVGGSAGTLTTDFQTVDGSALDGLDYTATFGTLTFDASDTTPQTIDIEIISDTVFETPALETFELQIGDLLGGAVTVDGTFTVTIEEDDSPPPSGTLQFTAAGATVTEGDAPNTVIVSAIVERVGGSAGTLTTDFQTVDGSALDGLDYTATFGTLTFDASDTTPQTIDIEIISDTVFETPALETFELQIGDLLGGAVTVDGTFTVTIEEDDSPPPSGTLQFTAAGATVTEGDAPNTVIVSAIVERVGGSAGTLTTDFQTVDGSALDGLDYTATFGTLTFDASDTTPQTIDIEIISDTVFETPALETFELQIGDLLGGAVTVDGTFTVTIEEDDSPPPSGTLQFTAAGATVTEGDAPNTVIVSAIVERVGGSAGTLTTDFQTVDGSALDGLDYTATFGTLTFDASDTTPQTIDIEIISDTVFETPSLEAFELELLDGTTTIDTFAATINDDDSPPPTGALQFNASNISVPEGPGPITASGTVTRTGGSFGPLSIDFQTANGTAIAGSDFTATSGTLTWDAGDTVSQAINITIIDDTVFEQTEAFQIQLGTAGNGGFSTSDTLTVSITDNDPIPPSTIQFTDASTSFELNENGISPIFQIERIGGSGPASVVFTTVNGSAVGGTPSALGDFDTVTTTINFPPNSNLQAQRVEVRRDALLEDTETFTATLTPAPGSGTLIGSNNQSTVTIIDNTPEPPTVQFTSASTGVTVAETDGGVTLTLEIAAGAAPASVDVSTVDGTATAPADYTALNSTTVVFPAGSTSQSVSIPVIADDEVEAGDNETFQIVLNATPGSNTVVGNNSEATVSIVDATPMPEPQTPPIVMFATGSETVTVNESDEGVTLTLVISDGEGPASVDVSTFDNTASAPEDFMALTSSTVVFPAGITTQSITIPIEADDALEPGDNEIFLVSFVATPGSNTGVDQGASSIISIVDTTQPPQAPATIVEFVPESLAVTVSEDGGTAVLELQISQGEAPAAVVVSTADANAIAPGDYTTFNETVVFGPGSTIQVIEIPVLRDDQLEGDESFSVFLNTAPENGTQIGPNSQALVTISNSTVEPGIVSLELAALSVNENDGSIDVQLVRTGQGAVSVNVTTADVSAIAGVDYQGINTEVSWVENEEGSKSVNIPIIADGLFEPSEIFNVTLAGDSVGDIDSTSVSIVDQTIAGTLQFANATFDTSESVGSFEVQVERTGGTDQSVSVDYTLLSGSATEGADFIADSGTLFWEAGIGEAETITVSLISDSFVEGAENFFIELSNAAPIGDDVQLGTPSLLTVNVSEDEQNLGQIRFVSNSTGPLAEGAGTVAILVERVNGSDGNVMVEYQTLAASAAPGADFEAAMGTLSWIEGETGPKEILINILDDNELEGDEEFFVDLVRGFPVSTELQLADPRRHTVRLAADTGDVGRFEFTATTIETQEPNGIVRAQVSRLGGAEGDVSVTYSTVAESAEAGSDFVAQSEQTLTWPAGDTDPRFVEVELIADALAEPDEQFRIDLLEAMPLGNDVQLGQLSSVTVVIVAQEAVPGRIQFSEQAISVDENTGETVLTVERVEGSDGAISADFSTRDGTALASSDYVGLSDTLQWADGDIQPRAISISLIDDQVPESTESFVVELISGSPNGVVVPGQNTEAVVTISDSDNSAMPADDDVTNPFVLTPVGELERFANLDDSVEGLGFEVTDTRLDGAIASGVTVRWSVQPAGAVEFPDGVETISDENGIVGNRIVVRGTGFIRIIAEAVFQPQSADELPALSQRMAPPFEVAAGMAFFTIRVGLEAAPGLTINQSSTGGGLDSACAALNLIADNLTTTVNSSGEPVDPAAQQDLIDTCLALESSQTLGQDLNRIAPEELFLFADSIVATADLQITNVYSRINAIRAGKRERLDLSGLQLNIYDQRIPGSVVDAAQDSLYGFYLDPPSPTQATGGGAATGSFGSRLGVFVSGSLSFGELDGGIENDSGRQQGADVETSGVTFGADYRLTDDSVIGAGIGIVHNETDFNTSIGGAQVDGVNFTVFGTWYREETGYIDLVLDVGSNSYDVERQINLTTNPNTVMAMAETDANIAAFTLGVGKTFFTNGWEIGPYARLSATRAKVDGFSERASNQEQGFGSVLDISSHDVESTTFSLGGQISKTFSTKKAVFVPQFRAEFESEDKKTKEGISATFQADPSNTEFIVIGNERDSAYLNIGLGSTAIFPGGHSGFLFYETRAQQDRVSQHWLKFGYRYEY